MKFIYVPSTAESLAVLKATRKALNAIADLEEEELMEYALYELIRSYEEANGVILVKEWKQKK